MKATIRIIIILLVGWHTSTWAAIIGTNVPAQSLTPERIATLPASQQPAWRTYLARSEAQQQADQNALWSEMKKRGLKQSLTPPAGHSAHDLDLGQAAAWYGGDAAQKIAAIILSYQTPAGGWSKNLDMTVRPRVPGEAFATDNNNRWSSPGAKL